MQKLPNILTIIRIILIVPIVILMIIPSWSAHIVAFIFYTIACVTDWFDGYIARKYKVTSPLGALLDNIADKLLVVALLLTLSGTGYIRGFHYFAVAIIILREVIIPALRQFLGDYNIDVPASMIGKVKTTVQMIALGLIMLTSNDPATAFSWNLASLGIPLLWVAAILTLWSAADYFYRGLGQFFKLQKHS